MAGGSLAPGVPDETLVLFIQEADDVAFMERFRTWSGDRFAFSYQEFSQTDYEKHYQIRLQKLEAPLTIKEIRRRYKCGLYHYHSCAGLSGCDQTYACLRCMAIKRGTDFVENRTLWSCKVVLEAAGKTLTEHNVVNKGFVEDDATYYIDTLACSVCFGAVDETPAIVEDYPPILRIRNRTIEHQPLFKFKNQSHLCKTGHSKLNGSKIVKMNVSGPKVNEPAHVIIYAPPGFGKTSFQHSAWRKGVVLLDTDDVPGVDAKKLDAMLEVSSVLTNRLDLISLPGRNGIMFRPKTVDVLMRRTSLRGLSGEEGRYWFDKHNVPLLGELVICEIENTYVADWFALEGDDLVFSSDETFAIQFESLATAQTIAYEKNLSK